MASVFEVDWESLPEELWLNHILEYLAPPTLSQLALVSRKFNQFATDPLLWASKQINLNKEKVIREKPVLCFLNVPRFKKVKNFTLDLSGQVLSLELAEALFRYINSNSCQISKINLNNVKVCNDLECFHDNSNLAHQNFGVLTENFTSMISDRQRELNANLVGRAIAKLDESKLANFVNSRWNPANSSRFVTAILQKITTTPHQQDIDFSFMDFSKVSPQLFAQAIASLRKAKFMLCSGLTSDKITALFAQLASLTSSSLESLILIDEALPENSPKELGRAVSKLKHLHCAPRGKLEVDQVRAILDAVPGSKLESLDIGVTGTDGVPIEIIRKAALHLNPGKKVNIPSTSWSPNRGNYIPSRLSWNDKFAAWYLLRGNDVFFW